MVELMDDVTEETNWLAQRMYCHSKITGHLDIGNPVNSSSAIAMSWVDEQISRLDNSAVGPVDPVALVAIQPEIGQKKNNQNELNENVYY